jgi:hypothetical protein
VQFYVYASVIIVNSFVKDKTLKKKDQFLWNKHNKKKRQVQLWTPKIDCNSQYIFLKFYYYLLSLQEIALTEFIITFTHELMQKQQLNLGSDPNKKHKVILQEAKPR